MRKLKSTLFLISILAPCMFFITVAAEQKETKNFKITSSAKTSPVGGNLKGTGRTTTETYRVSSGNIILRDSLKVKTLVHGRGGSCTFKITKEKEFTVKPSASLPSHKIKYPTEVTLITQATSPGCKFIHLKRCIAKTSSRQCELTGQYTD